MLKASADDRYPRVHPALWPYIDRYQAWSSESVNAEQASDAIHQPLYHYTSMEGLMGIIKSEAIWFTDYKHQNDPSEITFGINSFKETDISPLLKEEDYFIFHVNSLISSNFFDSQFFFFISCFTKLRNDFGMWRNYADDARGVAIGFSPSLFAITDTARPHCNPELGAYIRYETQDIKTRHESALRQSLECLRLALTEHPSLMTDKTYLEPFTHELALQLLALPVMWNCLTSKCDAYAPEKEYRLAIAGSWSSLPKHLTARLRGGKLVPYIAQPMPLRSYGVITEIVIGPAAPKDSVRTVRTMLKSLGVGWDIKITQSNIPYRAL